MTRLSVLTRSQPLATIYSSSFYCLPICSGHGNNLKGQEDSVLLVATGEIDEQPVWRGIPVKTLDPKGTSIALIQAAVIDPVSSKPIFQAVDSNVGEWLSLYASIGNFKST